MNKKLIESNEQETNNTKNINEYTHIIIYFDERKETKLLKLVSNKENIDLIKKEYENCIILSINELYAENNYAEKLNTSQRVKQAISYATLMHKNQYRHDGTEYIVHPLRVANYVKKYNGISP